MQNGLQPCRMADRANAGDPSHVKMAVNAIQDAVPSKAFVFEVMSHGFGWRGVSPDAGRGHDKQDGLEMSELKTMFAGMRRPPDVAYLQLCNGSTYEGAQTLHQSGVKALYFDEETGFHYNRLRYYLPAAGIFISQDPIGLNGGWNLFRYAPNPIDWIDPFGLMGFRVAARTDNGVSLGKRLKRKQAIKRVQRGQDVFADSKKEATALAKSCGREKPMRHEPHPDRATGSTEGRLPHVHPNNHEGVAGTGHIFFPGG